MYLLSNLDMRRKPGSLMPLELEILRTGVALTLAGEPQFHGYGIAAQMRQTTGRNLAAQGTLYRALGRLEERGLLTSEWQAPELAAADERPRRRLYSVTAAGEAAAKLAKEDTARPTARLRNVEDLG